MSPPKQDPIRSDCRGESHQGMVATASAPATDAGSRMLELGGNAVDAAVASAFCLGVTEPQASGLGGQSMVLMHLSGQDRTIALDGSSRAPFAIDPMSIPEGPIRTGLRSTTVPSTVATLGWMLQRYGKLALDVVLQPAIEAAREGVRVSALHHRLINREAKQLGKDPLAASLLLPGGRPLAAGQVLRQPQLASCMERLASQGWKDFYLGEIGEQIIRDMRDRDGLLSRADLSQIPFPQERPVLQGTYRKRKLVTFPPPGAGRALVQIMNILETFDPDELDPSSPDAAVILAHVFMNALSDRDRTPVDPDLYQQTRRRKMVDKRHARRIADRIRKLAPLPGRHVAPPPGAAGETTHLCAADARGNVVAITQSIELVFGSKRMNPAFGFLYNNYMNTFEYRDMTHPYYLLPGAPPWSSVAPTIVFRKGRPWLTMGSPGSLRIATSLSQALTLILDHRRSLLDAIVAPRLHSSMSGKIQIEKKRFPHGAVEALQNAGFTITKRGAFSFYLGCIQAIRLPTREGEPLVGVADPRRDGTARGPSH